MDYERCIKRQRQNHEQQIKIMRSRSLSKSRSLNAPQKSAESMPVNMVQELTLALPQWYKKIRTRFPWLTDDECVKLAETIKAAPEYTITIHSGRYTAIERPTGGTQRRADMSWSCCHAVSEKGIVTKCEADACTRNGILLATNYIGTPQCQESSDRTKPSPIGKCDKPITFSLEAGDFAST